ncbi:hypothetical protein CYMTET_42589 [Cymbomonas tetramitiformis]|uniref:RING-type domain-containing protein n=1 Tax=Cymbomonas tetramitiformis TaxID=36881 RepID=A0AAE0F133_9CHLO|nr:hypothetical protein CYMTET_42589 [Cymbomonas tetramitiformis]
MPARTGTAARRWRKTQRRRGGPRSGPNDDSQTDDVGVFAPSEEEPRDGSAFERDSLFRIFERRRNERLALFATRYSPPPSARYLTSSRSALPSIADLLARPSSFTPEEILGMRLLKETLPVLMKSDFSELHQFYVNVVNYPMKQRLIESRDGGRVDEMYNFLPVERRAELKMIPDAMDNILARLAIDESYINAPTVFISETNPDLATRANWVQFLVTNRLILSGGIIRDLPQLVGLQDYDRVSSIALVMIASVYICSVYKCAETRVSVCDHALTLAAAQLDGLFPPAFDRFVRDCCKPHLRENVASSDAPYTYDSSLTWSTEIMGFKFRDTFLKALFECSRGDDDAVMIRLKGMERAARRELGDNPSISRGFVWTQLCVVNVRIAVDALFRYGPRSRAFKPSRDDGVYTDLDMARMFFDVADGCGVHSPYDSMRYFNAPYSPKDGDALPSCPICLETTQYCNVNFVKSHDSVVNCKRCLQPVHSRCMHRGNLPNCPYCRASGDWSVNVDDLRNQIVASRRT